MLLEASLLFSYFAGAVSGLPTTINSNNPRTAECFVWADPFKLEEKTVDMGTYPVPIAYFARKANSRNCSELHHFQIFYRKTAQTSNGKPVRVDLPSNFCKQKAKFIRKDKNLASYVYAAKVGNKREGFFFACLMTGSVSFGSAPRTYFFEELYGSRMKKQNERKVSLDAL